MAGSSVGNSTTGTVIIGSKAGQNNTRDYVNAIGFQAGQNNTGFTANVIGPQTGLNNHQYYSVQFVQFQKFRSNFECPTGAY